MPTVRRLFGVLACTTLVSCCGSALAAPAPRDEGRPGKRPPTSVELADARKGYEAIGGRYFLETAFPEQVYHQFILPRTMKAADYAKVPDPPFEYWLDIELSPNLVPGAFKELGRLKNLRRLTLKCLYPPDLEPLGNLAPLLAELAAIPNLDHLTLGYPFGGDFLSDELASKLVEFQSLQTLVASGSITDAGLEKLAKHPKLRHLTLGNCKQVTDAGLAHLAEMKELRGLGLLDCPKVTPDGLKPFTENPRLTSLAICGTGITDDTLIEVEKIWTIEELNIFPYQGKLLTEAGLRRIGRLPRLRVLHAPRVKLTDDGLAALTGAGALERLWFADCSDVTDAGLKALTRLGGLKALTLHKAPQVTDAGLKELAKLPRLEMLTLNGSKKVTDAGIKALLRAETLTGLNIEGTAATEKGVREFVADRGRRLRELGVRALPVSDDFVAFVALEAPNLIFLDLSNCSNVTDKSVAPLSNLIKPRFLVLFHTAITEKGQVQLAKRLPECRVQGG